MSGNFAVIPHGLERRNEKVPGKYIGRMAGMALIVECYRKTQFKHLQRVSLYRSEILWKFIEEFPKFNILTSDFCFPSCFVKIIAHNNLRKS